MATPTLDEIEAGLNAVQWIGERDYRAPLLALVAHVRALDNATRMDVERIRTLEEKADGAASLITAMGNDAALTEARIAALEAKVATMGNCGERLDALEARVVSLSRFTAQDAGRIEALEAKVAAQAGPVIPVDLSEIHAELDRLRAENAELRKRVESGTWPAPQPIETAPLGEIMVWRKEDGWDIRCSDDGESVVRFRAHLRDCGFTIWLPMPPPGGAK